MIKKLLFFFIILYIIHSRILLANTVIILDEENLKGDYIGKKIEYIDDSSGKITINDILSPSDKILFKPSTLDVLNFGFKENPVWIKIVTENPTKKNIEFYIEVAWPHCDYMEFFNLEPDSKNYEIKKTGDHYNFDKRDVRHPSFIFKVKQKPGIQAHYLKAHTGTTLNLPIKIWSYDNLNKYIIKDFLLNGLVFGIFLIMIIYNFFLFIGSREFVYLALSIFFICFLHSSLVLSQFGFQFLWPNFPVLNNGLGYITSLSDIAAISFFILYLNVKRFTPKLYYLLTALIAFCIVVVILNFLIPYKYIMRVGFFLHYLATIITFFISIYFLRIRFKNTLYFFLAWTFLISGTALTITKNLMQLPVNIVTIWGHKMGSVMMTAFFSIALADKLNLLKNKLQNLNQNLEIKVEERTEELQASNHELNAINEELIKTRDALWGEMEIAKKIQTILLPKKPEIKGLDISVYMEPADEVGGDYYDIINIAGKSWIVIGDVSGHGVPSGLIMMMTQTAIHVAVDQNPDLTPSELLILINRTLRKNIEQLNEDKYMTITVFAVLEDNKFNFAGLHDEIMIYRTETGDVEIFETNGMWIGIFDNLENLLPENNLQLRPSDTMLLFTDGITEAWKKDSVKNNRDPETEMFGNKKLKELLKTHGEKSPDEIKNIILAELKNNYICTDDITMIIVKSA